MRPIVKNTVRVVVLAALCVGGVGAYLHYDQPIAQSEVTAMKDQGGDAATTRNPVSAQNNQPDPQVQEQLNVAEAQAKYRITSALTTIIADYKANEVDGDNKYRGKWVHFRSVAGSVEKDAGDQPFIFAKSTDPESDDHVSLRFDTDAQAQIASVRPGQIIDLYCMGNGKGMATPRFNSCRFLSGDEVTPPYAKLQGEVSATSTNDPVYQPSFDCSKQKGTVPWLICHDADLAAADVRLNNSAHRVLTQVTQISTATGSSAPNAEFKSTLREALSKRDQCADVPCIAVWYYQAEEAFHQLDGKLDTAVAAAKFERSLSQ